MVHLVTQQVEPEADAVGAFGPAHVCGVCIQLVIPLYRAPVVHVAERRIAADIKNRETALPGIRAIRTRNVKNIETDILSKVRTLGVVVHPGKTPVGIEEQRRGDDVTDTRAVNVGVVVPRANSGVSRGAAGICAERAT